MTEITVIMKFVDGIGWLYLNRPKVLNALNTDMLVELTKALGDLEANHDVRAVIITGMGRAFCAGADIRWLSGLTVKELGIFQRTFHTLLEKLEKTSLPVVAAVNGPALGGGFELLLATDFVIAADTASFGLPEVKIGLIPGAGGTQRLVRAVGRLRAKQVVCLGEPITAAQAAEWGLARVVPADQVLVEAGQLVARLAALAPNAVAVTKRTVNVGVEMPLREALEWEIELLQNLYASETTIAQLQYFLQRLGGKQDRANR